MRLASSKTMLFLNDSWMAQLGSESVSQKPTSIGRLSARGEAASRSETVCITHTTQKQETAFAPGFPSMHCLHAAGSCWCEGHLAQASTTHAVPSSAAFKIP